MGCYWDYGYQEQQVWNVSNNNQLYTSNIYTNIHHICLTSEKTKT